MPLPVQGLRGGGRPEPPLPLVPAAPPASAPPAAGRGRRSAGPALSPSGRLPSPPVLSVAFVPTPCSRVTAPPPVPQAAGLLLPPSGQPGGGGDVRGTQPTVARASAGPRLLPARVASGRRAVGGLALPRLPAAFGKGIGCGASPRGGSPVGLAPAGARSPSPGVDVAGFSLPSGECRSRRGCRGAQRQCGDLSLPAPGPGEPG